MNDVTVVTSVTYPSSESLALVADVQYHEPYLSAALNRKFRGIVDPGFYAGFLPKPGGGMNLLITSVDGDKTAGAASVDIGEFYQVTIQQRKDISLALSAGKKYAIVLKGRYLLGEDTYQVNTASHIHAAEFVARTYTDSYQLGDGELLVCTVNIPASVSAITQEMIDTSERINRSIGIDISDSVTSTRSDVAASSLAVKKAYDLAKSKYTAQDASTTQKGLVQLSSATNSDSETMAATPKAVKSIKDLADTKAPIESPSLTGTPTAPTAAQGTNSTQIANTAFVKAAITALINGAPGTLDTLKEIAAAINNDPNYSTTINNALALKAPLASPALTGVPTAPTAAQGTNNTQIATTAYVRAAISALVGSSPEALDTLNELAAALGNDPNFATTMTNALAGKQPLDATLTALAALATGANKLPYFTGKDTVAQTDLTSVGRDILAKTSTLAVIQYLGLRELGTSGEKIPLLSTANTWSARQTFNGGITGALTGNADTATKLKTAININGVRFDGSADITLTPKDLDVYSKSEIDNKKGMRKYTFSAPANAVSGKWYPIVFRRSGGGTDELASRVVITTYSSAGGYAMNNCEFNGFVMPGGWSDRGSYAAGFFSIYSTAERAIHSIISSVKDDDLCSVFYVEARAFPIKIFAEEGLNVIVPTTDYTVGQATYKWGATDPVAESTNTQTILDFKNGRGYYCSHQFVSSLSGNAATATKLASSINIGGVSFDGSADIDLPGVNTKGNQDTTGNAATATKLQTACTINGVSFDGSKNIELTAEDLNLQETVNKADNAVQKTGDTLSGGLTFENDSILAWIRNTDWAKIGFKNDADSDTDSYMWFETGDNGNEYFKWRSRQSTTTKDLMNLKWDALYVLVNAIVNGEVISKSANGLRIAYGNYGFFIRNDGSNTYFMLTNSGDNMGTYNGLRPLWINNATGAVSMGRGLNVSGETLSDRFAINSSTGMWINMRDQNVIMGRNAVSTDGAQALLRQDHADRKFMIGGLGNKQFGIYMINNSRTANGTDGQAYMDNNGNWLCGAQIIPGNYGNFDSRYVKDIRLGTRVVQLMARGGRYEKAGHAITGLRIIGEVDGDDEAIFRPIQKYINGTWYNVAQV
ncbi:tail fiber protein [Escherichia coli]|uniref:phage tail fiber protein n=3 Tax=Escherichia coli TaxID=562 RepID=UPI0015E99B58|nr:tail fiber protein [Escherichia coli]EFM1527222.1 phage tail protein [Escherichia coli]EIX6758806.1 tail fiber protein [Escherichia coli]EKP2241274.1 tail fiber protein [Escherichia coli]EKP2427265.1 tail fiber protein [Escherichia coli]EKQ6549445.1 tail fiber protein [Escherichia coli]